MYKNPILRPHTLVASTMLSLPAFLVRTNRRTPPRLGRLTPGRAASVRGGPRRPAYNRRGGGARPFRSDMGNV